MQFWIHQYRECYESLRQHDRFIWQIAAIAVTIAGGLGVAAFGYVKEWFGRGWLFMFAAILTGSLLYAAMKHRYFSEIEQRTLCKIEELTESKLIQRITSPVDQSDYWYRKTPNKLEKCSAHIVLIGSIALLFILLLGLTVWAFIKA